MNEVAATNALKTVINAAKATLVLGLTQGGLARQIVHLETTSLATPTGYYAIAIDCTTPTDYQMDSRNISSPSTTVGMRYTEYEMEVRIADYAYPEPGESAAFITAHTNFRKLCDRIAYLLETTKWYPDATSKPRFRLQVTPNRSLLIRKNNEVITDESLTYMVLAATLRFTITDNCDDGTKLYP